MRESAEHGRCSIHLSVVLGLVISLVALTIISKTQLVHDPWLELTVFVLPMPLALLFKDRIVRLGPFAYVAALLMTLGAGVLFGT